MLILRFHACELCGYKKEEAYTFKNVFCQILSKRILKVRTIQFFGADEYESRRFSSVFGTLISMHAAVHAQRDG